MKLLIKGKLDNNAVDAFVGFMMMPNSAFVACIATA